jgi:octanoyl-[GcvH]:protein N-octanoyltransferase
LIRKFYELGKKGENTKFDFPKIQPELMASLSELLGTPLTIQDVMLRFMTVLSKNGQLIPGQLYPEEFEQFSGYYDRMIERNARFLPERA